MASYRTTIRSDNVELDLNTTTYNLSLSRTGAQGSPGTNGTEFRLSVFNSSNTYDEGELVVASTAQSALLYRAVTDLTSGSSLTNTAQWQEVGGDDNLTFTDSSEIDFTVTGNDVTAALRDGSINNSRLQDISGLSARTYNSANVTVNTKGIITAITEGSGGGGSGLPSEAASITLTSGTTEIAAGGSAAINFAGTISVNSPYTYVGTGNNSGNSGTDTLHVAGASAVVVTHTGGVTGTGFSFSLSTAQIATPGTWYIRATVFATHGGITYSVPLSFRINVYAQWYTDRDTTQPSTIGDMTGQGGFSSGERVTMTRVAGTNSRFYVALPTRAGGYTFHLGFLYADVDTITSGFTTSGYTLYRMNDYTRLATGEDLILTIST